MLAKVLPRIPISAITNGIRATGLYPLDPDAVDYTKCMEIMVENEKGVVREVGISHDYKADLDAVHHLMGENQVLKCRSGEFTSNSFKNLYTSLVK